MRWLRAVPLLVLLAWVEWAVPGCSSDDNTGPGQLDAASQPEPTRFEAGTGCSSSDDCQTGLVCLNPVATFCANKVCVAPPGPDGGGCAAPQYACSCLGEVVQVCDGYAQDPVDTTSTCDGGILPFDSGAADGATESGADAAPPLDAGLDALAAADATADAPTDAAAQGVDASDAAGE